MRYFDRLPSCLQILMICLLYVAVYVFSTVFFTLACFELVSANIQPRPYEMHGESGIAAFFFSTILGVFFLGPLTTVSMATYLAYRVYTRDNTSVRKEKRKNDSLSA